MAGTLAHVLGWTVLLGGTGAIALAIGRRAGADGILAPLLVGLGLRLAVMLVAHFGSLSLHDHGILFVDDRTHFDGARLLAGMWREGHFPDPVSVHVLGTFQFGYPAFVAAIFTLGTDSILLGKLANVLLGVVSVFLVARIAGNVLGERAKLRAAWLAALAPTLIWWSAPLLKEALATVLVLLAVLAVTELPRRGALVTLAVVLALLMVVRTSAVLALVVGAAVAIAIAGRQAERRWLSRPVIVFGTAVVACLAAAVLVVSHGDVQNFYNQYHAVVSRMVHLYQGSDATRVPYDAVKSLVTPLPWVSGASTENWDRGLYPGVWLLFCALPLAALGLARLRRRPEGWLLAVTIATAVTANAFTSGFEFRQRSMVEPLILLLALAGARSWRMAAQTAAAAIAVVAAVAGVQSHSPVVAAVIAAAAGGVLLLSRWIPARPFEPLPESPMVSSFRTSLEVAAPAAESTAGRTREALVGAWRRLLAAAAAGRAVLAGLAPRLGRAELPPASRASTPPTRGRLRRSAPVLAVLLAFAAASILIIPRIHASGTPGISTYALGTGRPPADLRLQGSVGRNAYGFVVEGYAAGRASFTVRAPLPREGRRTYLLVWGGGDSAVSTRLSLIDRSGTRHLLGTPATWKGHRVDVTPYLGAGAVRLEFATSDTGAAPRLFADQVRVATYRPGAIPRAGRWEVAAWTALAVLLAVVALRRSRRDALLVAAAGIVVYLAWPAVVAGTLEPSGTDLAQAVAHAKWLDLDHGLLSGTFGTQSALGVQLFHALTPVTGTGAAGVRTASLLVGVLALVGVYALGRRLGGSIGGITALTFATLADPFRLSLSSGDSTSTLVLAACLFLLAVHYALERGDRRAMIAVGVTGALAVLAQPLCWPGVVAAIAVLALRRESRIPRRVAFGASLVALGLVLLPSRLGVAHQSGGDAGADVVQLASNASTLEFGSRPDGSPRQAGLGDYLRAHSPPELVRGTVSGASDGLSAAARRPESKLVGVIAFLVGISGAAMLILLPRLRLFVLIPAVLAVVPWFFVGRGAMAPFTAEAMFWPALALGAAAVAHAALQAMRGQPEALPRPHARDDAGARTSLLARRLRLRTAAKT